MRQESVTSPGTPGAGRRLSYSWFGPERTIVNVDPAGTAIVMRPQGVRNVPYWLSNTVGAPPAVHGARIYKGRVAWCMTSDAATAMEGRPNFTGINRPLMGCYQEVKGPAQFAGLDDWACWSFSAVLAFENALITGPITGDLGLIVASGTRFAIRTPAFLQSGMEIGPTNTGAIGVLVRQVDGGPSTFAAPTPLQPDITQFHKYEIRILSATGTSEALVKFMIDGQVQFVLPYGAGTVLPSQNDVGNMGMEMCITNRSALATTTAMFVSTNGITVCVAPTEEALA